ncbi:hypothetical protein ES703_24508 [subsurface metagenome]
MGKLDGKMKEELQLLFHALCDGLRQEVRQRHKIIPIPGYDFSLVGEREIGVTCSLAWHLRLAGFVVQIDTYVKGGNSKRRPDFGIWLPASQKYIYLEFKLTAWGSDWPQYDYARAIKDIDKLERDPDLRNHPNGLIALGFSNPEKRRERLQDDFEEVLSQKITSRYPSYEKIRLERIDLENMDVKTSYAMIGLWFRKQWEDS